MKKKEQGFSLIEILVVIAIVGLISGITATTFINIIKASNKSNIITEIKQNGDAVTNRLERIIRNAEEISAIGAKNYGVVGWNYTINPQNGTCDANQCAIIIKNTSANEAYTKIQFNTEYDRECNTAPFGPADQDTTLFSPQIVCNGNIRMMTNNGPNALVELQTTTTAGQLLTNTELRSGVSVRKTLNKPLIEVRTAIGKPPLVYIRFTLAQGIKASSRIDSLAEVPFESVISLRNY
jgi:prepilin-type N-terminal cleavage/methylation domain-containing protein